jgi:hypothetical protein
VRRENTTASSWQNTTEIMTWHFICKKVADPYSVLMQVFT